MTLVRLKPDTTRSENDLGPAEAGHYIASSNRRASVSALTWRGDSFVSRS